VRLTPIQNKLEIKAMPMKVFTAGDLDGFFGLFVDNLLQILLIAVLGTSLRGFSPEMVAQRILPGVAERRVAEVVRQRHRFHQVFVQVQQAGDGAGDLRHFEAVGEAGAKQVAFVVDEHLGLVFQPPERGGMNDAVTVALEFGARRGGGFGMQPPAGLVGMRGVGCEWGHGRDAWSMSGEANAASVQHSEACRNRRNPAGTASSTRPGGNRACNRRGQPAGERAGAGRPAQWLVPAERVVLL
jgi:hypothetical protein